MYQGRGYFARIEGKLGKEQGFAVSTKVWDEIMVSDANRQGIRLLVDNTEIPNPKIYMQGERQLFMAATAMQEILNCGVHLYNNSKLVLERYETTVEFIKDAACYYINGKENPLKLPMVEIDEEYYLPLKDAACALGYRFQWNVEENRVELWENNVQEQRLPQSYDLRKKGRACEVKNQGSLSTCWAVAALTAVESSLLPEEAYSLSPDHMNHKNSFSGTGSDGGEYAMAVAYLTAWQGPVLEEQDVYGDDVSPEGLEPVKHIQEVRFPKAKDYNRIKEMVYRYGGVESSIYSAMSGSSDSSGYYNRETNSYCYPGETKPNHEIVIIGWDDTYPKENFTTNVPGDGAFLCQNSWGEDFGERGSFYVSYYDSNIGVYNVAYTKVESNRNYDRIYQSDLCGWVGHLGYDSEKAFFANVYTTKEEEEIQAAGFYALGENTEYKVYLVEEFEDKYSLYNKKLVAEGKVQDAGFYTVPFTKKYRLPEKTTFAVMVEVITPGCDYPVAIEFSAGDNTESVDITDGEGYISFTGNSWENVEEKQGCNLCLKVYTNKK